MARTIPSIADTMQRIDTHAHKHARAACLWQAGTSSVPGVTRCWGAGRKAGLQVNVGEDARRQCTALRAWRQGGPE